VVVLVMTDPLRGAGRAHPLRGRAVTRWGSCADIGCRVSVNKSMDSGSPLYIDYVPTDSNIADVPSRWHEMSATEREEWLPRLGQLVEPKLPNVADASGRWLSYTHIAKSLWDSYTPDMFQ